MKGEKTQLISSIRTYYGTKFPNLNCNHADNALSGGSLVKGMWQCTMLNLETLL